jgi:hypothetical protein
MLRRVFGGAALVAAGIAAFIEAHSHRPHARLDLNGYQVLGRITLTSPGSEWSQTAYDLVRIGAWALVIFGALLVAVGLIGYARLGAN